MPSTALNLNLILLDPAHGGQDNGAQLPGGQAEKEVTLAFAQSLRTLLQAKGFTVLLTRENSSDDVLPDTRVEQANRAHPLACLLLHAAGGGHGVHLYTSSLTPLTPLPSSGASLPADGPPIVFWDTAQSLSLPQSTRLLSDLSTAFTSIRMPLVTARGSVRPIDSLSCPAVALEIAPLAGKEGTNTSVADPTYQHHVAEAVTQALVFWRSHAEAEAAATAAAQAGTPGIPTPGKAAFPVPPKARPRPKPIVPPVETPDILPQTSPAGPPPASPALPSVVPPAIRPAPIVRAPSAPPPGAAQ